MIRGVQEKGSGAGGIADLHMELGEWGGLLDEPGRMNSLSEITNHSDDEIRAILEHPFKVERETIPDAEKMKNLQAEIQLMGDISGTTSAQSRKMTAEEYSLMLYKRKLRNRQSASKSRKRHQMIVKGLQEHIEQLVIRCEELTKRSEKLACENAALRNENMQLNCEGVYLKAQLSLLGS